MNLVLKLDKVEEKMKNNIEIYKSKDGQTQVDVNFDKETVWLNQKQMGELFSKNVRTVSEHINNVFSEGELDKNSTIRNFRTVQNEGNRQVERQIEFYNLDVIISVGYRVKSKQGTQFRQWATKRLNDFLVKGYAINEKRLAQKQQEVEYLKTGIRIIGRTIESKLDEALLKDPENDFLLYFSKGLQLLDDYDHEALDKTGLTKKETVYPDFKDYMGVINEMYSDFDSQVFAKPKDESFLSSINQIRQSFDGVELYPSMEEKAANLLYFIVKNHSFVDGNKRIGAACFLYFLQKNNMLFVNDQPIISNEALASLTLFIAISKADEVAMVKQLIISLIKPSVRESAQLTGTVGMKIKEKNS